MTFRNNSQSLNDIDLNNSDLVMSEIDKLNKKINLNLIILNFKNQSGISKVLEEYLVNLNKNPNNIKTTNGI